MFVSNFDVRTSKDYDLMVVPAAFSGVSDRDLVRSFEVWNAQLWRKKGKRPAETLRVAFVSVWSEQCGISTYAEQLFPELSAHLGQTHIFAEELEGAEPEAGVTRCWKRGTPMTKLIREIEAFAPDIVHIEHEYGIFPDARHWLSLLSNLQKYRTVVKLHSVYRHKDKIVCESAIDEAIVHTEVAKQVLEEKRVPVTCHVIPHGSVPTTDTLRLWNIYRSPHTLVQFGFGFEYKGWETAFDAVAKLVPQYPDVFFTALFSMSAKSKTFHEHYYTRLHARIRELGIHEHVALIKGYQSDESLQSYLRSNAVAMFPYRDNGEHTVYGCSGAARVALGNGIPTIVSSVPLFADLDGVCPRVSSSDELAKTISRFFADDGAKKVQVQKQFAFLDRTSWTNVARQHLDIYTNW